ncbi:MAG: hypothetical protein AAGD00_09340 [Planctomycetota bacterium]
MHMTRIVPLACLFASLLTAPVFAQNEGDEEGEAPALPPRGTFDAPRSMPAEIDVSSLPAMVRLGLRAESLRDRTRVLDTLVIVPDTQSYIVQLGRWRPAGRWPVLIDDGTPEARENILRFARSFEPADILFWSSAASAVEGRELEAACDLAFASSWGATATEDIGALWGRLGFTPPGLAMTSSLDSAWPAALALANFRGTPLVWINTEPRAVNGVLAGDAMERFAGTVASVFEQSGWSWETLGDDLDALILCVNMPTRYAHPEHTHLAVTDRVGRHEDGERFAVAGLIFGNEAQSAYRAMAGLFCHPDDLLFFDGYEPGRAPAYDIRRASQLFARSPRDVVAEASPNGGVRGWRSLARRGIRADFVHVNSSGRAEFFDLDPGRAFAGDITPLREPAFVHFIHSFAAQRPADPESIAGRFFASGAYAFVGSVHEPFLSAFQPIGAIFGRLRTSVPVGAAVRYDNAEVWKINVLADPLITLGPDIRTEDRLAFGDQVPEGESPVEGAQTLEQRMHEALRARRMDEGVWLLRMLDRSDDALRVVEALLAEKDDPDAEARPTTQLLESAMLLAFERSRDDLLLDLWTALPGDRAGDPLLRDLAWNVARARLNATTDADLLVRLREHTRGWSAAEDAKILAPALRRVFGIESVRSMYAQLIEQCTIPPVKRALQRDAQRFR